MFQWTQALHEATGGKLIAIDGKTLRRSFARKSGKARLHLVTAWSSQNGLTLGQVACEEKSNEITAIPELLKLLSLKGCTVTIDAMGCQTEIAAQIRTQQGHYVLAVKGNQPTLEEDLVNLFQKCLETEFAGVVHDCYETTESGHGRIDDRIVHAQVTRAATVLLGRNEAEHFLSPAVARISWVLKDEQGIEKDYQHFGPPLILAVDQVFSKIRNLTYRYLPDASLFPTEITQYDPWVIRETQRMASRTSSTLAQPSVSRSRK